MSAEEIPSTSKVVRGHGLVWEGAPHDAKGNRIVSGRWATTDGPGHAKCQCGVVSENFASRRWRRVWHRQHKAQVLAGQEEGS